jgi:hypothetical protein
MMIPDGQRVEANYKITITGEEEMLPSEEHNESGEFCIM